MDECPCRSPGRFVLAVLAAVRSPYQRCLRAASDEALQKVVIVTRHGVRAPTISTAELDSWSSRPWPAWNEPMGNLTARGAELAKLLGHYHRGYLVAEQLLPEQGCPPRGSVYVYADLDEPTRSTAEALIDGMAPGCGLTVSQQAGWHP